MIKEKLRLKPDDINYLYIAAVILIVHLLVWIFSGNWPFMENPYNSYILQAKAWCDGSFDLGRGYSHLELAEYDYRFFVSFPQFPAMVYLPLVLLGIPVCDGFIAFFVAIGGAMLCYSFLKAMAINDGRALLISLLMTCGSNMLFVSVNSWVWFIAQNMCFTLTMGALLCAIKKKAFWANFLWACAIGCRPFQILYFPIICMLLYHNDKSYKELLKKPYVLSGAVVMGIIYMWLNYARFGNILEFGHNYLPEFTEAPYGQFNILYLKNNLYSLIKLPTINAKGYLEMPRFDGMNIFIASPVFAYAIYLYIKDFRFNTSYKTVALITILIELIFIALHKTMGGWQFGNRYTNDCLPLALVIIAMSNTSDTEGYTGLKFLTLYGILINICGTIMCYGELLI